MSIRLYETLKAKFFNTKPIRGRAVEVRPYGRRSRDWEQIICKTQEDGQVVYGARFHQTDVLLVMPNGDIQFDCGGWHSPTTGMFMDRLSAFSVYKRYNKLWVHRDVGTEKLIATLDKPVLVRWDTTNPNYENYRLDAPATAMQKVIDPLKAKAARQPAKAFVNYARAMLKILDGWVTHDLRMQYVINEEGRGESYWFSHCVIDGEEYRIADMNNLTTIGEDKRKHLYECMCSTDEARNLVNFPKMMVLLTTGLNKVEGRGAWDSGDKRFAHKSLTDKIDRFVLSMNDVHKLKEVVVTKAMTNLV